MKMASRYLGYMLSLDRMQKRYRRKHRKRQKMQSERERLQSEG
jgi:hypothetical protein